MHGMGDPERQWEEEEEEKGEAKGFSVAHS